MSARVRTAMGRELARLHPVEADLVVPVPDSGNYAALGFARNRAFPTTTLLSAIIISGAPSSIPRSSAREFDVKVKLNIIKEAVAGKRVVVVDDSIVRGTTARARVMNLREAGAKEVHIRISCPPHRFPAITESTFPIRNLIANQLSIRKSPSISRPIPSATSTRRAWSAPPAQAENKFCMACFNQKYPVAGEPGTRQARLRAPPRPRRSLVFAEDTVARGSARGKS